MAGHAGMVQVEGVEELVEEGDEIVLAPDPRGLLAEAEAGRIDGQSPKTGLGEGGHGTAPGPDRVADPVQEKDRVPVSRVEVAHLQAPDAEKAVVLRLLLQGRAGLPFGPSSVATMR